MLKLFPHAMQGKHDLFKQLEANNQRTVIAVFDNYPIDANDVARLVNIINTNTHMRSLRLVDCQLLPEDVQTIAQAVLNNKTLEELKIEVFEDDPEQLKQLLIRVQRHLANNIETERMQFDC